MCKVVIVLAWLSSGGSAQQLQIPTEQVHRIATSTSQLSLDSIAPKRRLYPILNQERSRLVRPAVAKGTLEILKELALLFLAFNPALKLSSHFSLGSGTLPSVVHDGNRFSYGAPVMSVSERSVSVTAVLSEQRIKELYCWLARALAGDERYGQLMTGFAAVFGELEEGDQLKQLLEAAVDAAPGEDELVGETYSLQQRERNSLGAMGGAQWRGYFNTRPHSLLDVRNYTSVDEWVKGLAKSSRKTLKRAGKQNFTVTGKLIDSNQPAPHSTLAHFRCVVEHEVRLLAKSPNSFFAALQQAVGRYVNTLSQAGEIYEYRNQEGRVIAFAHEVRKGRVIRGQWFYGTDEASKSYVWFHSVKEMVQRAIEGQDIDYADLGPSGADAFTELKERYGFASVENWHLLADYTGAFRYGNVPRDKIKDMYQNAIEGGIR